MNRPFWSLRRTESSTCESIEPLLPLYADGMASPEETRRVEMHLPSCKGCRAALSWMQATHRALAARPVALPPADLHSRIAQAIAASSAASVSQTPGVLRAARSFRLRPAYAAAASLTVVGLILSHSLWHTASQTGVKPIPRPAPSVAAVPSANAFQPALPRPISARLSHHQPQVALVMPGTQKPAARPVLVPRKAAPSNTQTPKERVASAVPVPVSRLVSAHAESVRPESVRPPAAAPHDKIASIKAALPEQRQPAAKALPAPKPPTTSKLPDAPLVAAREKELPPVPVKIAPPVVVEQALSVQVASAQPRLKSDDLKVRLAGYATALRTAPYAPSHYTAREASSSLAGAMQALNPDRVAFYGAIHSPTATK